MGLQRSQRLKKRSRRILRLSKKMPVHQYHSGAFTGALAGGDITRWDRFGSTICISAGIGNIERV